MTHIGLLFTVATLLAGCHNTGTASASRVAEIEANDSIPAAVKEFVKAVANDDSTTFASLVSYPLERPYPLTCIADSAQMVSYYRVLVDDSLKQTVVTAGPEDWTEAGWRGWMLKDGSYVWIYDNIYSVNYLSGRERRAMARLVADEIASLPEYMRQGVTPVGCYKGDNGAVYRIDKLEGDNNFRLALYTTMPHDGETPSATMPGTVEIQGTVGNPIYTFVKDGTTISFEPYATDDDGIEMEIANGSDTQTIMVQPAYWRDIIK